MFSIDNIIVKRRQLLRIITDPQAQKKEKYILRYHKGKVLKKKKRNAQVTMGKQKESIDQLEDIARSKTDWPMFENRSSEPWLPAHSLELLFIYLL